MSKAHRGSGIRELVKNGRSECPVCKRTGIKTLYEVEAGEKKLKTCKQCKAAVSNGKKQEELAKL
jgi:RNA polymerase subunit RPABC4/transcription elongation factor Spt4